MMTNQGMQRSGLVLYGHGIRSRELICPGCDDRLYLDCHRELKRLLDRIVSLRTRLIARSVVVAEPPAECITRYEFEYRDAGYETKYDEG
jgi:hypothetical protein